MNPRLLEVIESIRDALDMFPEYPNTAIRRIQNAAFDLIEFLPPVSPLMVAELAKETRLLEQNRMKAMG